MKESFFVRQNSGKWKDFEKLLNLKDNVNPDQIAALYIQLMDDLAYSKTFFPESPTHSYLNQLSIKAHGLIYKNKKEKRNRIVTFWKHELPEIFYHSQRQLLYAFLIFTVGALIGAISTAKDDTYIRLILGDSYVNMTLENIEKGDPMAVYSQESNAVMFSGIMINNIRVAFLAFASGILFSIGTFALLFNNGVMLGAFQYFFFQKGLLLQSVLAVWLHGTLEISAIIIAGCAGLVMGNSILFPGTYSRSQSFSKGARQGLKIIIGVAPIFIIAALIEGYLTRYSKNSQIFDFFIIGLSLFFIIFYFIYLPIYLNKKANHVNGKN